MWMEMSKQALYSCVFMWPDLAHICALIWRQTVITQDRTTAQDISNHTRKCGVFKLVINERWREDVREKEKGGREKKKGRRKEEKYGEGGRERNTEGREGDNGGEGGKEKKKGKEGEREIRERREGEKGRGGGREKKEGKEGGRERKKRKGEGKK